MREGDRACTAGMQSWKGCRSVRGYGWQIGGLGVALAGVVGLGMLAFGCGSGAAPPGAVTPSASPSVRASVTADPRVAEVEAAARRYIEAVEQSAKTGDASEVDKLVVAGSQAEGNAAITANFSRENRFNFIASRIDYNGHSWRTSVGQTTASISVGYSLFGHTADWPSLRAREEDHQTAEVQLQLEFELRDGKWLVVRSS
jgi:hypothetical protein